MLISWSQYLSHHLKHLIFFSHLLWCNSYIKTEDTVILFENSLIKISTSYPSYLKMAGSYHGSISKMNMKETNDMFFLWGQLKHAIPIRWKTLITSYSDVDKKHLYQNHVTKGARILFNNKLCYKELHLILVSNIVNKPTSNICF